MRALTCFLVLGLLVVLVAGCTSPEEPFVNTRPAGSAPSGSPATHATERADLSNPDLGLNPKIPLNHSSERIEEVSVPSKVDPTAALGIPGAPADAPMTNVSAPPGFGGGLGMSSDIDSRPAVEPAMAGTDKRPRAAAPDDSKHLQVGTLTAGSFDDNLDSRVFAAFAAQRCQDRHLGDLLGKISAGRLLLLIKDGKGQPVGNARVQVTSSRGAAVDLVSRTDGRVVVLPTWDGLDDFPLTVTVTPSDGPAVKEVIKAETNRWEITLPDARGQLPRSLDLAIVLDTTGSMGDELNYLKAEMKSIAAAIHDKFPNVEQRYSLILYRDDGDEYVTRSFDFASSLDKFRENLGAQSAGGGGDKPEAVHRALEDALQLRWRDGHTARVLFLVGDAPPHAQHYGRAMKAVGGLRQKGVSIYPVACSDYDNATELLFRSSALMTGGQFLFLTNDSGVGNSHAEPHIPFYHVQKLDQMMVRMIAGELAGKRVDPERHQILRNVGKPPN